MRAQRDPITMTIDDLMDTLRYRRGPAEKAMRLRLTLLRKGDYLMIERNRRFYYLTGSEHAGIVRCIELARRVEERVMARRLQ